jgi:hypothetical protein
MAGRAAVLAWEETKQANPCVPSDHTGIYQYGGLSYNLVASPSGASFESCSKLVTLVLKQDADCGAPVVHPLSPLTHRHLAKFSLQSYSRVLPMLFFGGRRTLQLFDIFPPFSLAFGSAKLMTEAASARERNHGAGPMCVQRRMGGRK